MKNCPKVSVIIPVYNVQDYLRQCMESVVNQTLRDIEIICVDDQSTDNSLDILNEYAGRDPRIIVITQKNAGAGAARNNGLKLARGEYLSFLDSDDFFELDMLEKAYNACLIDDIDFVVFRSDKFNNDTKEYITQYHTIRNDLLPSGRVFSYKDIKRDIFKVFVGWAWDKLYRREFVLENNLYFQEQRTTNDLLFVFSALVKAKKITVLEDVLAHHRISLNSSLSNTREKSWQCFYNALLALRDELQASGIYEEIEQSYINYALHFSLWNLNTLSGSVYQMLYNALRIEYFNELGITKHGADYFWNKGEYEQYLRIMRNEANSSHPRKKIPGLQKISALINSLRNNGLKYTIYKVKHYLAMKYSNKTRKSQEA